MTALSRGWASVTSHLPVRNSAPTAPVVVVGTGPVGIATARELLRRDAFGSLVIYGDEPWEPYNRVRLSALLAGELGAADLVNHLEIPEAADVVEHHNCAIVAIDRESRTVTDALGRVQPYSSLVLATGSHPHVPNIAGIRMAGVYCFRDMNDAQRLLARQARSRRTVVLGGGLLGLEAAKAMQRAHTEVYLIEHAPRLMHYQLDEEASEVLREHVLAMGIHVILGDSVQTVTGNTAVESVRLASGRFVPCDTVVVATGIRPNTQLALEAGLAVGRGIKVNDRLQTSDPAIYAVGECCQHRGQVYGLVAPGLEQAAVAAHNIRGGRAMYRGSIAMTRLKVMGQSVFSMGVIGDAERAGVHRQAVFIRRIDGAYRKLVLQHRKLIGAIALGEWSQTGRVQEAISEGRWLWPWQLLRFRRKGLLWSGGDGQHVASWPATAAVCTCTGVTRGRLTQVQAQGCDSVEALAKATGASTVCGSCRPLLAQLLGSPPAKQKCARTLWTASLIAFVGTLGVVLPEPLAYSDSVQGWRLDALWLDRLWKQVSGFTLLGLSVLALAMSLRKRWQRLALGDFAVWRLLHALVGTFTVAVLVVHTGLHFGRNLNLVLMTSFVGILLLGALAGGVVALEHKLGAATARRLRDASRWAHIALFWPLPALLSFHVAAAYYF